MNTFFLLETGNTHLRQSSFHNGECLLDQSPGCDGEDRGLHRAVRPGPREALPPRQVRRPSNSLQGKFVNFQSFL